MRLTLLDVYGNPLQDSVDISLRNRTLASLQITFSTKDEQLMADIDIDEGRGTGSIFGASLTQLNGYPTHPYNIHELLIFYQRLDPGYRLVTTTPSTAQTHK